jgi:hypothetical protein
VINQKNWSVYHFPLKIWILNEKAFDKSKKPVGFSVFPLNFEDWILYMSRSCIPSTASHQLQPNKPRYDPVPSNGKRLRNLIPHTGYDLTITSWRGVITNLKRTRPENELHQSFSLSQTTADGQDFITCQHSLTYPHTPAEHMFRPSVATPGGILSRTKRNHRCPCTTGNRYSSTEIRSVTVWHNNSTIKTHIIVIIILTSDKLISIRAEFSMKDPVHQGPEWSTPKLITRLGGLASLGKAVQGHVSLYSATGRDDGCWKALYPLLSVIIHRTV